MTDHTTPTISPTPEISTTPGRALKIGTSSQFVDGSAQNPVSTWEEAVLVTEALARSQSSVPAQTRSWVQDDLWWQEWWGA